MKIKPLSLLAATLVLSFSGAVSAQEYMFTYSKLFTQLKNNLKEHHPDVKVGLFFVNPEKNAVCPIDKAWMEKEKHYEELSISPIGELIVPLDNNLKQANPLVFVQTTKEMRCDFSMVVMTKDPLEGNVSYQTVQKLLPQMKSLLGDLGGMFSGWFTPDVSGLTLEFADKLNGEIKISNGKVIPVVNGIAQVTTDDIGVGNSMRLPQPTVRVMPYIPAASH